MANFKIKQLDVKCGMTIEINGTWTRIDRGLTLENLNLEDIITKKEIMEQFSKAQSPTALSPSGRLNSVIPVIPSKA